MTNAIWAYIVVLVFAIIIFIVPAIVALFLVVFGVARIARSLGTGSTRKK